MFICVYVYKRVDINISMLIYYESDDVGYG